MKWLAAIFVVLSTGCAPDVEEEYGLRLDGFPGAFSVHTVPTAALSSDRTRVIYRLGEFEQVLLRGERGHSVELLPLDAGLVGIVFCNGSILKVSSDLFPYGFSGGPVDASGQTVRVRVQVITESGFSYKGRPLCD